MVLKSKSGFSRGKHKNYFTGTRAQTKIATLLCKHCGSTFNKRACELKVRGDIPFCGRKCWFESQKIIKKCPCGDLVKGTRHTYCSQKCFGKYAPAGMRKKNSWWYENGYKVLYSPGGKSIKEHVKISQEMIGRKLRKGEIVHHINGIKDDNRPENLQVMTAGEHSSLHRKQEGNKIFGR